MTIDKKNLLHIVAGQCYGDGPCMRHDTKLSDKTIQKIKRFVEVGGYLFTENLQIEEILERAFKKVIVHTKFICEKNVSVSPAYAEIHPYQKSVFEFPSQSKDSSIEIKWKIDEGSMNIRILNKDMVTVLITSPELVEKNKDGKIISEGTVVVTINVPNNIDKNKPGGQVLHIMTHFNKQSSKAGEFALQNLLVNFLMDMAEKRK